MTQPIAIPTTVKRTTCTVVWKARRTTGASIPFRADFETSVTEIAHVEWNKIVASTLARGPGSNLSILVFYYVMRIKRSELKGVAKEIVSKYQSKLVGSEMAFQDKKIRFRVTHVDVFLIGSRA